MPEEEVRFAVVLNGGVSLAVWMGGVVLELDRLTKVRRDGTGPYAVLKRLTGCAARADVITGTSAGGINGAALALTQVNRGADPALLRDLWIDQGRIESLLRQPFQGEPTSLLKGDEYFLPKLNAAFEVLAKPVDHVSSVEAPINLTITTTVIRGNQAVSVDSMGQQLPQSLHAGRFQWQRVSGSAGRDDPFSEDNLTRTAHRLALAARSSASFPVAFEPSFVPVGNADHRDPGRQEELTEELRLRPDMSGVVRSWGTGGKDSDRSRYCVDGGALANTPTLVALTAVEAMPASGPVRRVMLLVFPHAPQPGADPPDSRADPPSFAGALTGILGALQAQGGRSYVEALEAHNLAAAGRRGTRSDILEQLDDPNGLEALTKAIYSQYKQLRRWRAGRDLAAWRTGMGTADEFAASDLPREWSFERVRAAAHSAQDRWAKTAPAGGREPFPYAPTHHPRADNIADHYWGWGVTAAVGLTEAVSDLLRRLVWVLPPGDDYETVRSARASVLDRAEEIRRARALTDASWKSHPVLTALPPDAAYWMLRLACYDHQMIGSVDLNEIHQRIAAVARTEEQRAAIEAALAPVLASEPPGASAPVGRLVRRLVDDVIDTLRTALPVLCANVGELQKLDGALRHWQTVLVPEQDPERLPHDVLLARLLQLEITSTTLGDEVSTGASVPVELVQISAQTENPFATYTRTGEEKLGGDALNRFGGFLKRSWRVNDWVWGRVDGATVLCRTMLDPKRIRRTALLSGYLLEGTTGDEAATLAGETVNGILSHLGSSTEAVALRDRAVDELAQVFDTRNDKGDLPSALPNLAAIFAWAMHLESVPAELPVLAQAVAADRVDGGNPRSRGEVFVEEHHDLLRRLDAAGGDPRRLSDADRRRSLEVFDRAGIGWEPLREEVGSDLIIRTAASAAAVMSTVADSRRFGLKAAKPVTRAVRGAMLLPYWAIWGLTSRGTVARGLAMLALASGGVALALALFGVLSPNLQPVAVALGTGAVLAVFAYGALRTGSLLHGVVLLTPLIPLAAYAITTGRSGAEGVWTLVMVLVFTLGLMLLGSIGVASGSVWAAMDGLADRHGFVRPHPSRTRRGKAWWAAKVWLRRLGALLWTAAMALGLLVVGVVLALLVAWFADEARIEFVQRNHGWLWVVAVALIACGAAVAHYGGRWLQVLTCRQSGKERHWVYATVVNPRAASAGWSVVYGIAYLGVAWVVSLESLDAANPLWRRIAFATALTFALVLLLVLPFVFPLIALREVVMRETGRGAVVAVPVQPDHEARRRTYADDLAVRGVSYRRFVASDSEGVTLTARGERLEQRVCDVRAAASLLSLWNAPPRPDATDVVRLREVLGAWETSGDGALVSARPKQRLAAVKSLLATQDPDPSLVRHAVDRLVTSLRRSETSPSWRRSRR